MCLGFLCGGMLLARYMFYCFYYMGCTFAQNSCLTLMEGLSYFAIFQVQHLIHALLENLCCTNIYTTKYMEYILNLMRWNALNDAFYI